jgi:hypothetical protein
MKYWVEDVTVVRQVVKLSVNLEIQEEHVSLIMLQRKF